MTAPLVLEGVPEESTFWREDHFAPLAFFAAVDGLEEAARRDLACPLALGSSIFAKDLTMAEDLARKLPARVVTINDTIAPTADPRLPFGGCRRSGFGVTRGEEGLLSLTQPKVIVRRKASSWTPHFQTPPPGGAERDRWLLEAMHGPDGRARLRGLARLVAAQWRRKPHRRADGS